MVTYRVSYFAPDPFLDGCFPIGAVITNPDGSETWIPVQKIPSEEYLGDQVSLIVGMTMRDLAAGHRNPGPLHRFGAVRQVLGDADPETYVREFILKNYM